MSSPEVVTLAELADTASRSMADFDKSYQLLQGECAFHFVDLVLDVDRAPACAALLASLDRARPQLLGLIVRMRAGDIDAPDDFANVYSASLSAMTETAQDLSLNHDFASGFFRSYLEALGAFGSTVASNLKAALPSVGFGIGAVLALLGIGFVVKRWPGARSQ